MIYIFDMLINYFILIFLFHFCWGISFRNQFLPKLLSLTLTLIAGVFFAGIDQETFIIYALWCICSMILLFKNNVLHTVLVSTCLMVFTGMIDSFSVILSQIIFLGKADNTYNLTWWKESAYIFSILFYLTAYFLILKKNQIYLNEIRPRYKFSLIFITLIFELVVAYIFSFIYTQEDLYTIYIHIRFFLCLFGAYASIYIALMLAVKNTLLDKQNNKLVASLHMIQNQYEYQKQNTLQIRKFKHDITNHMGVLNELIAKKDFERASTYISQLWNVTENLSATIKTGDDFLDAICNHYRFICENVHIRFEVKGHLLSPLGIDPTDVTTLFGNALQNSYEASKNTDSPFIKMKLTDTSDEIFVTIENSCMQAVPSYQTLIPTIKENKAEHGFGLQNIKEVINRNNGEYYFSFDTTSTGTVFKLEFSIQRG